MAPPQRSAGGLGGPPPHDPRAETEQPPQQGAASMAKDAAMQKGVDAGLQAASAAHPAAGAAAHGLKSYADGDSLKDVGLNAAKGALAGADGGAGSGGASALPAGATPAGKLAELAGVVEKGDGEGHGAGGLAERDSDPDGVTDAEKAERSENRHTALKAGATAPMAAQVAWYMMLVNFLKTLFMTIVNALLNLIQMIMAVVMGVVNAVTGFFVGIGSGVASFLGGGVSATAAAWGSFMAFTSAFSVAIATVVATVTGNPAIRDGAINGCAPIVEAAVNSNTSVQTVNGSANTTENAKKVYSFLAGLGMSPVNIAGILGNWSAESGIDPTGVETIFDEPFTVGPKKKAAESANFAIASIDSSYAAQYPAIHQAGIGLGQWTNDRDQGLVAFAKAQNKSWSDIDIQLAFMATKDSGSSVIKKMITTPQASPGAAADFFRSNWEGISDNSDGKRTAAAADWYAKFQSSPSDWTADKAAAQSLVGQGAAVATDATAVDASNAANTCREALTGTANNSSLAEAILSYAYPNEDLGRGEGNKGTPLWQELHDHFWPGDPFYESCDRTVSTAVRWTGTDSTYPIGNVEAQWAYLQTSPKWQRVTEFHGDPSVLKPGDVLINYHFDGSTEHTLMWVGADLAKEAFGSNPAFKPGSNVVSGSYSEHNPQYLRSPGVGSWYSGYASYAVFRSVGPDSSPQAATDRAFVPKSGTTVHFADAGNAAGGLGAASTTSGGAASTPAKTPSKKVTTKA